MNSLGVLDKKKKKNRRNVYSIFHFRKCLRVGAQRVRVLKKKTNIEIHSPGAEAIDYKHVVMRRDNEALKRLATKEKKNTSQRLRIVVLLVSSIIVTSSSFVRKPDPDAAPPIALFTSRSHLGKL